MWSFSHSCLGREKGRGGEGDSRGVMGHKPPPTPGELQAEEDLFIGNYLVQGISAAQSRHTSLHGPLPCRQVGICLLGSVSRVTGQRSFLVSTPESLMPWQSPFLSPSVQALTWTLGGAGGRLGKAGNGLGREQRCRWMAKPGAVDVQGFDAMMGSN